MNNTVQKELDKAFNSVGLCNLARHLGRSYQAVKKWRDLGRLPRTEYTGETNYSEQIERITGGKAKAIKLCPPINKDLYPMN